MDRLDPLDTPLVLDLPHHLTEVESWHEHMPFAFFCVAALRPRVFVELGTHKGDSYCAFCQAVAALGTGTRCYAVDTWAGDPHAGFYGPEILATLRAHHDPRYGGFSRLVQTTFDDAVHQFADGEVDLLHIDGLHTYDAVRHDFETWLPKLSDRAVVLFHDTNVRERGFGVWQFWAEVSRRYPGFEFLNCNGLGVLAVGADADRRFLDALASGRPEATAMRLFAALGQRVILGGRAARSAAAVAALREEFDTARVRLAEQERRLATLTEQRDRLLSDRDLLLHEARGRLRDEALARRELEAAKTRLTSILASSSWRVTAPLRLATGGARRLASRRAALAAVPCVEEPARRAGPDDEVAPAYRIERRAGPHLCGWVLVTIDSTARPRFYSRDERRFVAHHAVALGARGDGRARHVVRLPDDPTDLWLDLDGEARARPEVAIAATLLFRAEALAHLATARLRPALADPRRTGAMLGSGVRLVRREGVKGAMRRLAGIEPPGPIDYAAWVVANDHLDARDREAIANRLDRLTGWPAISVVVGSGDADSPAARSVQAQIYPHRELCLAPDGPAAGLARATGAFVMFLDPGDRLAEHALYAMAEAILAGPDADLVYADEDTMTPDGVRDDPWFKTEWNDGLILGQDFVGAGLYRAALVREAGAPDPALGRAAAHDLALRVRERSVPARLRHVAHVLVHRPPTAAEAATRAAAGAAACAAVAGHLRRTGSVGTVEPSRSGAFARVRCPRPDPAPKVSVIVPTRDQVGLLRECVDGLLHRTDYPDLEVIVVDNRSEAPETRDYLAAISADPRVRTIAYDRPFNYAAINNVAAASATGALLCLLNNDIKVMAPDWLDEMVSQVMRDRVGVVGAMLYYPNDTIQHAGVILGVEGVAAHAFCGEPRGTSGYFGRAELVQDLSATTAACLVCRKEVFDAVGGFDEINLPVAFNDVDFCLRVAERGWRVVWTPYAELYHYESVTRGADSAPENAVRLTRETDYMRSHWRRALDADRFYNPNLSLDTAPFMLARRTRAPRPWRATP